MRTHVRREGEGEKKTDKRGKEGGRGRGRGRGRENERTCERILVRMKFLCLFVCLNVLLVVYTHTNIQKHSQCTYIWNHQIPTEGAFIGTTAPTFEYNGVTVDYASRHIQGSRALHNFGPHRCVV